MAEAPLTIARLARATGVGLSTVRFYERRGLLTRPARPARGYRVYPPEAMDRIRFIQRAKAIGFSLKEIAALLDLRARRGARCDAVRDRACAKLLDVERRLAELEHLRTALQTLVSACRGARTTEDCSILKSLSERNEPCPTPTKPARPASQRASGASKTA